jgi:hypothetical protein
VTTTTFFELEAVMARNAEGASKAAPVISRKKSRRLREMAAATSRGLAWVS